MHRKTLFSFCTVVFPLTLLLLCSGCGSQRVTPTKTMRYALEYEPPVFTDLPPLETSLRIGPFSAAPEFDSDRILYRAEKYTLEAYNYHVWMAKPAAQVQFFLGRDLQRSGLFNAVLTESGRYRPAYLLGGSVEKFLEIDEGNQWFAELSLNIILQRLPQAGTMAGVLEQHNYQARKACSRQDPQAVAEAMSMAMEELSRQIQQDTYTIIRKDLAEKAGG